MSLRAVSAYFPTRFQRVICGRLLGRIELINRVGQAVLKRRLSPKENRHTIQLPLSARWAIYSLRCTEMKL